jgi:hypothetical protein
MGKAPPSTCLIFTFSNIVKIKGKNACGCMVSEEEYYSNVDCVFQDR